jgi:AcrR family transcriptional regulator
MPPPAEPPTEPSPTEPSPTEPSPTDGRRSRWAGHREARRRELVTAAAAAIAEHGPDVHLDQIAAAAGVSKPVLYRHFSDKDDLLAETARWGAERILARITAVLTADLSPREVVDQGVRAYLAEVQENRNLFLLAVRHRGRAVDGSVASGKSAVAAVLARALGSSLRANGADPGGAEPWAQALVGLGVSTAEWWLERETMDLDTLAGYLSTFIWHAVDGISRGAGPGGQPASE